MVRSGICALCRRWQDTLCESHFLPKGVYKIIGNHHSPGPVLLTRDREEAISCQAKRPLLCLDCEGRFNTRGENWTLKACACQDGFKLREILLTQRADPLASGLFGFDCAEIPYLDTATLSYFAISIIWRAAACRWRINGVEIGQIDLGIYAESFRQYLLGTSGLPSNTVVSVVVSSLETVPMVATFPQSNRLDGYRTHFFSIPGLDFTVDVGSRLPDAVRELCISRGSLIYGSLAENEVRAAMLSLMKSRQRTR